jgi:hypothetical protein
MLAWGAALAAAHGGAVRAQTPASEQALQRLMERTRAATPSAPGANDPRRLALLQEGEAALAACDPDAALSAFERAALMHHAADTEMGLVRSYLQAGGYRRAVNFGAHTAGAHRDVVGGALLYAWLLQAGGQGVAAQRLLAEALMRNPADAPLLEVLQQLRSGQPVAGPLLRQPPLRLAPYASATPAEATAWAGSAMLLADGHHALVPLPTLMSGARRFWLRNGLGQTVAASVQQMLEDEAVGLLRLADALPFPVGDLALAARDPFPGSAGFAIEFARQPDAEPAWPWLRSGFFGRPQASGAARSLGIEMGAAGPRGGPVFDAAGRLCGLALPDGSSQGRLLGPSRLAALLPGMQVAPAGPGAAMAVDQVYETGLRVVLQVLADA